jgi:superfamily I DNA/RNA helicase
MENASLRVSDGATGLDVRALSLSAAQERVVRAAGATMLVVGPPGSGKTTALAARALARRACGVEPLIICSHDSGTNAFLDAIECLGADREQWRVATLPAIAAQWLSQAYLASASAGSVVVGGRGAAREILSHAARGLLDMTWPLFARSDIDLDLPHLSRPDAFLDEAAVLFSLLQRSRVTPEEFEEGCAAGLAAFYGEQTERAVVLLQDPAVLKRASARGRDACRASAQALAVQRRAERDLCAILVQLYREYRAVAASEPVRAAEDITDAVVRWLCDDEPACKTIASAIGEIIVDDAEDAEPGLASVLEILRRHRQVPVVLAGCEAARVDGFEGRRSALASLGAAERIELPPLAAPATLDVARLHDEREEADWLAQRIRELVACGVAAEKIAVLSRTEHAAAIYAQHLRERGVPASKPGSRLERDDEMADLLALCAIVDDPLDQEHLLRVLSSPLVGLSDASLRALCRDPGERRQLSLEVGVAPPAAATISPPPGTLARNMDSGEADGMLPETALERIVTLRTNLRAWRAECRRRSPVERFVYLAGAAGFRDRWHAAPPGERERLRGDLERTAQAVAQAAISYAASDFRVIARLIEDEVVALGPAPVVAGAVVTDSIVAVKGRRFDHVFVAGVAHERFPRIYTSRAMAFSRTYGLIVRENIAGGAAQTAKFAWYYAKFGAKAMYVDEERRALEYGLSRARVSASASGFGTPPYWAREHDLLAGLENR